VASESGEGISRLVVDRKDVMGQARQGMGRMKGKGEKYLHPQASISWSLGRRGIPKGRLPIRSKLRREHRYPIGCLRTLVLLP
jgi:hypothetical protein